MDDLVRWLGEQLDEDERIARAAANAVGPVRGASDWQVKKGLPNEGGEYWSITTTPPDDTVPSVELVGGGMSGGGVHGETLAAHIAAHDPARVLREIDAKRQVIEQYESIGTPPPGEIGPELSHAELGRVLRLLALPYADRPGYRAEWRP